MESKKIINTKVRDIKIQIILKNEKLIINCFFDNQITFINYILFINFIDNYNCNYPIIIRNDNNNIFVTNSMPINYDSMEYCYEIESLNLSKSLSEFTINSYIKQLEIQKIVKKDIEFFKNISQKNINLELFKINGKSLEEVAVAVHYSYYKTCHLNGEALDEFDKLDKNKSEQKKARKSK